MPSVTTRPLQVGAVSYLNTKPLVFGLESSTPRFEVILDLPSRLADGLAAGYLDVALIPSVEFFQHGDYTIVSDACIACRGPVWSVKLLSRVPMARIRTMALDEGSRTSIALASILLRQRFGLEPATVPLPIGADPGAVECDAVLLIGDRAMHVALDEYQEVWDLGEEWCRWSRLPFVFAMWVARSGVETTEVAMALQRARDAGVANLAAIARHEAPAAGLSEEACRGYLRDHLHFYLGPEEQRGLHLFRELAAEFGFAPQGSSVRTAPLTASRACEPI